MRNNYWRSWGGKLKGPDERDIRNNPLEFDCGEVCNFVVRKLAENDTAIVGCISRWIASDSRKRKGRCGKAQIGENVVINEAVEEIVGG
jgi:hypothetical protein